MWPVTTRGFVAGLRLRGIKRLFRDDGDAVLLFERRDIAFAEPDRHFNRNRCAVIREHEALKVRVPVAVRGDAGNDQRGSIGGGIGFFRSPSGDQARKTGWQFRSTSALLSPEQLVRA
jgi:hypothetical protein